MTCRRRRRWRRITRDAPLSCNYHHSSIYRFRRVDESSAHAGDIVHKCTACHCARRYLERPWSARASERERVQRSVIGVWCCGNVSSACMRVRLAGWLPALAMNGSCGRRGSSSSSSYCNQVPIKLRSLRDVPFPANLAIESARARARVCEQVSGPSSSRLCVVFLAHAIRNCTRTQ